MKVLYDFFPLLLFFAAFKLYDIYIATAAAIVASLIQVGAFWLRHRRFETVHLITLGAVGIFGGLTLLLHDDSFIKWKPTIVNWAFAAIIIGSHLFRRKTAIQFLLGSQLELPERTWRRLNLSWGAFFTIAGVLNLYVAFWFGLDLDEATRREIWVNFKVFGLLALTFIFALGQAFVLARYMNGETSSGGN